MPYRHAIAAAVAGALAVSCSSTGGAGSGAVEPAEAGSGGAVPVSAEHVRETCGTWQDILDILGEPSNYFADNLDESMAEQAELRAQMSAAANRSGDAELSAAAATWRRIWDRNDSAARAGQQLDSSEIEEAHASGDVMNERCGAAGVTVRDPRLTEAEREAARRYHEEQGQQ